MQILDVFWVLRSPFIDSQGGSPSARQRKATSKIIHHYSCWVFPRRSLLLPGPLFRCCYLFRMSVGSLGWRPGPCRPSHHLRILVSIHMHPSPGPLYPELQLSKHCKADTMVGERAPEKVDLDLPLLERVAEIGYCPTHDIISCAVDLLECRQ